MGKLHGVVLIALVGCGKPDAPSREPREVPKLERVALQKLAAPVDDRFDAQGALHGSGKRFAWLELPKGFAERPGTTQESGSFEAEDMAFTKVRDYLDDRIKAEQLRLGQGSMHFLGAQPTHTGLAMERLDVRIFELEGERPGVRLRIEKLRETPGPGLPLATTRAELERRRQRAE